MENNIVLEFIKQFQNEGTIKTFTEGCCYYFAIILSTRFLGNIVYNDIDNHFAFERLGEIYDITGKITDPNEYVKYKKWVSYMQDEPANARRVCKDCITK